MGQSRDQAARPQAAAASPGPGLEGAGPIPGSPAAARPGDLTAPRFALIFVLLFAVAALPLLASDLLPLVDYPNHLARMHILGEAGRAEPLARFYEIRWRVIPNLAMDLIVPGLARLMPLAWAGKVFVLASFLLLAGGVAALYRIAAGRWSAWPGMAFLFLYSRVFLWGFLNYLFGVGLALAAGALWLGLRRRHPVLRLAVAVPLAVAIFLAHVQALGVYALLVAGLELGALTRAGRAARPAALASLGLAAAQFILPALLWALGPRGSEPGGLVFGRPVRKLDLLFSVFDNYHRAFDVACFVLLVLGLGWLYWRRVLVLAPLFRLPLGLLTTAYLALPTGIFTGFGADHRMPLVLALVLVAGSDAARPGATPPARGCALRWGLAAALLLFVLRTGLIALSWSRSDAVYEAAGSALDALPRGSTLAVAYPPEALNSMATPLVHLPTLAIISRDAFVPTLFAHQTQQPVSLRPEFRALAEATPPAVLWNGFATTASGAPPDPALVTALRRYDFVVFLDRAPFTIPFNPRLRPVRLLANFQLFRIVEPGPFRPPPDLDDPGRGG